MLPNKRGTPRTKAASCGFEKFAINNHERVIVYRLGATQVFYDKNNRLLYFADLDESPVHQLLEIFLKNELHKLQVQELYLDVNYYFPCGYRARLRESLVKPLLVALRLQEVRIEYQLPKANIDNPDTPWFISTPID